RTGRFVFVSGTGERFAHQSFVFGRQVTAAFVALNGYEAQYDDGDHHLQTISVELRTAGPARVDEGWQVDVRGEFLLRDDNGDDNFSGSIDFVLFVVFQSLFGGALGGNVGALES